MNTPQSIIFRIMRASLLSVAGLFVLVSAMGQFAWFATPHTEDSIERASGFHASVTEGLSRARAENQPAPIDKHPGMVTPQLAGAVHRVEEWHASKTEFSQAPMLNAAVASGNLPPVAERLPINPLVIVPPHQTGPYGGTWTRFGNGPQDVGILDDRLAYDGLVRWDAMGRNILPNLATHWTVEDEGKLFTFYLRKGVRWSDGVPFTAEDIRFWYDHVLLNPDITPVIPRDFMGEAGVMAFTVLDPYTVQFRFPEPKGTFLLKMASGRSYEMAAYPLHHLKQFHIAFADSQRLEKLALAKGFDLWNKLFNDEWEWRSTTTPRIWPWVMEKAPPARPITLVRNPFYWKVDPEGHQLPYIDRVTFEIFDNETINFKAINGEIGMQGRHLEFRNYSLFLEHREKGGYRVVEWIDGSSGPNCLLPNLNHKDPEMRKLLGDRMFRIALSHAIDRNAINEIGYFGIGEPRQISPPRSSDFYWEAFSQAYTSYDPEFANQVLDSLGLDRRDGAGTRLLPDGRPLTISIETTAQSSRELEIVASNWREIGIAAQVKELARQLWTERKRALTFDVAVWGGAAGQIPLLDPRWYVPIDPNNWNAPAYGRWYATRGKRGEEPTPGIRAAMDLWSRTEQTVDEDEQKRLFRKILELNLEHLWIIGMVGAQPAIFIVGEDFRNVPEVAVSSWMFRTPGNTAPECYAIEPGDQRISVRSK